MKISRFLLVLVLVLIWLGGIGTPVLAEELESELQQLLVTARTQVVQAQQRMTAGQNAATELAALQSLGQDAEVLHLLLVERYRDRRQQLGSDSDFAARQEVLSDHLQGTIEKFLAEVAKLRELSQMHSADLQPLRELLDTSLYTPPAPLLGALPYRHLKLPNKVPQRTPVLVPAYSGGSAAVTEADLRGNGSEPIAPEIAALAESLGWSPVAIYQWMLANVESEWYWGGMKGAAETLRQRSGNDADQAALLIALLRASNFPARYVRGTIEFAPGIERLQNLLGVDDPTQAMRFLQQAGIPAEPMISGGRVGNVRIEHIWVETYVPYANYRGAVLDEQGKIWLPLDSHLKPDGYLDVPAAQPPADELLNHLREDYLAQSRSETPLEYLRQQFTTATGSPWDGALHRRTLNMAPLDLLPADLQFKTVAVTGESVALPTELEQTVTFRATGDDGNELFSLTLPTAQVSNRQVVLSCEPETVADQEIIAAHGGLSNTPAYLVRLRPLLTIDGERRVVARDGLAMGSDYQLTVLFNGPSGRDSHTAQHTVGNLAVLGIAAQQALPPAARPEAEQDAAWLLQGTALRYNERWNAAEEELAAALHLAIARPLPTLVTVGGVLEISRLLDTPRALTWKGLFMDAGLRRIEAVAQAGQEERIATFMRLAALQGSALEARTFVDDYQVAAVSTAQLLALSGAGTAPVTLDSGNSAALLPTLTLPDNIRADIETAIGQGQVVTLPVAAITLQQWTGYGYRKEDPYSGEAGYMLSGMIAGGMTVEVWAAGYRSDILQAPFADPPNRDPLAAAHIVKIPVSDRQNGVVGEPLPQPLAVLVTDIKGRPVVGATVTFSMLAGGGRFATPAEETATTDGLGIARVHPLLGEQTSANPSFRKASSGDAHATQVGVNQFSATVASRYGDLNITQPFEAYGFPQAPHHLVKLLGKDDIRNAAMVNNPAGTLAVQVVDHLGNPVSNVPVTFTVKQAVSVYADTLPDLYGLGNDLPPGYRNLELYRAGACPIAYPIWGECPSVSALTVVSAHYGAMVDTFMGDTLATIYTVESSAADLQTETFQLHTVGWSWPRDYWPPQLSLSYLTTVNAQGAVIDATRAGTAPAEPLQVAMFLTYNETQLVPLTCYRFDSEQNKEVSYPCWDLVASNLIKTRKIDDGRVVFTPKAGEGSVGPTENAGDGIYRVTYTTGVEPALNILSAVGEAEVAVPLVHGKILPGDFIATAQYALELESGTLPTKTVTLRSGQMALFDDNDNLLSIPPVAIDYQIYGVGVQTSLNPQLVMLGDGGLTRADTQLGYVIEPAGYAASDVQIDLFAGSSWQNYLLGSAVQGAGSVTLSQGSVFDPQQAYSTRVVLNRGSTEQMEFDKIPLPTLYADLDLDSDNNAGTNADGTHALPSRNALEDQVEDLAGFPGKVIQPNLLDVDKDKVPGFADGIDRNEQAGENASAPFVPLLLELDGSGLDPAAATVRFNYPGSDPDKVQKSTVDGKDTYAPAPGSLRIWTKDGGASRKAAEVSAGGDYVAAQKDYTLAQLGTSSDGIRRFYVEGLSVPAGSPTPRIAMTIDPDGVGPLAAIEADAVLVTPIIAALVPDYNHNREIDDEDRLRAGRGDIFYYWINDDDDAGDLEGSDLPGSRDPDCWNTVIDGTRDLTDLFPLQLDIKALVEIFSPNQYIYLLRNNDSALNVAIPNIITGSPEDYLEDVLIARQLEYEMTFRVPAEGLLMSLSSSDSSSNLPILGSNQGTYGRPGGIALALSRFSSFLQGVKDKPKMILLFEGRILTQSPLVFEIFDQSGNQVFSTSLNLSIDGIEQMFRQKNLITKLRNSYMDYRLPDHEEVPDVGSVDRLKSEDSGFVNKTHFSGFDADNDDIDFVFVHGYNVNDQEAREAQAEVFKRLYWSGSKARFWGITWYGWESQADWPLCYGRRSIDYHANIRHAFNTGRLLRDFVVEQNLGNATFAAHSLGNMVISSAIRAEMPYARYIMVNAAVAEEAYTPETDYAEGPAWVSATRPLMYHPLWRYPDGIDVSLGEGYQPFLWATEWYKRFTTGDDRAGLTWRNLFSTVREGQIQKPTYAFYTPTDEAFRPFNYNVVTGETPEINVTDVPGIEDVQQNWSCLDKPQIGTYAFAFSELLKGRMWFGSTVYGGWGFNLDPQDGYYKCDEPSMPEEIPNCNKVPPAEANVVVRDSLKSQPFFSKDPDQNMFSNQPVSITPATREELLANEIPALTYAAGHRGVGEFTDSMRNIDIRQRYLLGRPGAPWPRKIPEYEWRHNDLYFLAYPYIHLMYDDWAKLTRGELIQ